MKHLIVTALLVFVAASPASAVTLMVNGDTPARRWQRPFASERVHAPMPDGRVDLYLTPCPFDFDGAWIGGCALISDSLPAPRIHIESGTFEDGPGYVVATIAHELGHVFDEWYLTDVDRARFAQIWRRPAGLAWGAQLAPPRPLSGSDGYRGLGSPAEEWFADIYQACLLEAAAVDRGEALELIDIKTSHDVIAWRYRRGAFRQIAASCRLIEQAVMRPPVG